LQTHVGRGDRQVAKSAGKAYDAIRSRILSGSFPPKFHLRESELAEAVGVSRTPVREALRKLASDGYVQFIPNRGAFVAEWTEASLTALIDVRAELAAMAGRLAASHVRREDLQELGRLNRAMSELADRRPSGYLTEVSRLNLRFHNVVLEATGNPWLLSLMQQTAFLPMVQRAQYGFQGVDWKRGFERYNDLIDALAAGDGEWAAAALRTHFLASKHALQRVVAARNVAGAPKKLPTRKRQRSA
jgi:DNA-binding GntR family transcriptional regulator